MSVATKQNKKKVFIRTFGCQMNVRDSEVICGLLRVRGYELIAEPKQAEVIILNTCSVRQHAEDKVWSEIGRFGKDKTQGRLAFKKYFKDVPRKADMFPIIGVVGCMAQNYQEKVFERAPQVDFVVGPSDIYKIPDIISEFLRPQGQSKKSADGHSHKGNFFERKIWEVDACVRPEGIYHTGYYEDAKHAYVVISEGCSNCCSYCVVPYVRGRLHNRDSRGILREIEEAIDNGLTQVTLLGQNVNSYKAQKIRDGMQIDFIGLLKQVNRIRGLEQFSFLTSHPKDTTLDLFRVMTECEKLKKYLHLPVQAGSDRILKLMKRGYTRKFYLDLINHYRKIVNNGVLTSDIIVGYPTETEEDFQDTCALVRDAQFNAAFIFKYSPRPHTEAARLNDTVERKEKERRHRTILNLQKSISLHMPLS